MITAEIREQLPHIQWLARGQVALATDFESASNLMKILEAHGYNMASATRAGTYCWVFQLVDREEKPFELYVVLNFQVLWYEVAYWNSRTSSWVRYDLGGQYNWENYNEALSVAETLRQSFLGRIMVWPSLYRP